MPSGTTGRPGRPVILFLGAPDGGDVQSRTFAGVRRYAAANDWDAVAAPEALARRDVMRALLARHRPVGCVLDCANRRYEIPQRFFGDVPAVRINPSAVSTQSGTAGFVAVDNEAVARLAFDELCASLPRACAVIPSSTLAPWSIMRARTFRALAAAARRPCAEFPVWLGEPNAARAARMRDWLAALPRGTAVFAVTDRLATIAAVAAHEARLRVPQDLAILGVDDRDDLRADTPVPISSIKIDFERTGFLAAKILGERKPQREPKHAVIGPLMVVRRASTRGRGRRAPWIPDAIDIIRAKAAEGLTAAALAAQFPVSRNLFERRFREAMGHSVLDEILHVRMEMALTLLARPDFPIGAISDFCGFGCDSDLRKLFRKRMGISMRRWRAENIL